MTAYVQVPVPEERVQEVIDLLATTKREEKAFSREYDLATMGWLWKEAPVEIRHVLKHLMCHAGDRRPTSELIEVSGVANGRTLGGVFARFRERCVKRYGRDLPWETIVIGDENYYVLSEQNAEHVNHVY